MSRNLNNNSVNNAFGEKPSVGRNTNDIRIIMLQHSQRTVSNQRPLALKRARLNLEGDLSGRTCNIYDVYEKLDTMNDVLNTVLKNTSSEKAEATTSIAVEKDMLPGHQPTLDQLLRDYLSEEKLYDQYNTNENKNSEGNRLVLKSVTNYLHCQEERKKVDLPTLRTKIVRHIGNRKLQEKKQEKRSRKRIDRPVFVSNLCERRQSALKANWAHFVNSFGENVDSILHADYMSDLESDDKREEEEQNSSSEKSFFWRFCPSWRSEEGDRFVDELDADYEAAHDKKNNTHSFEHKFKGIRDKQLSKTKANKLPSCYTGKITINTHGEIQAYYCEYSVFYSGVLPISTGTKADLSTKKTLFQTLFFAVIQSVSMLKVNNQGLRRMCIVELSLGE
ncbi:hypothetical protein PHYBLDRAFT_163556 [Phycomyces blakesleeanus NRRL 1555(-)]|uniref:Uncharacterized protein n=1 Tax=Phycomyces blakesleeanus (strain ATCC 8743b / DSM 1359 / FGSC 10004 / NBRC 33097 / NRRL 1555) TaxID=763407 RepID=A0A167PSB4_PHYB8|nr:hypothetical protein PHYBLDRAFT_163556 [Phycomyces blakesleeanus NRRL 1555(-)]OAD78449.1 hypothetical protein PHYBLDRAFT_163556 [Phycomyces blakesleeanus NRRL 1555(-)]|eukprot:XP_018296489.1 hypothetical protein PHYBLDRAFT_163556 [Phycomyces blakesleeanus NRRL 1555(-)]